MSRPDIPHLLAGLVLAAMVFVLLLVHVAVPDFFTGGALFLFGIAGGATLPFRPSAPASALSTAAGAQASRPSPFPSGIAS